MYEACGSVCDRTCRALSGAEAGCKGERMCEEGCFCPTGKYLTDSGQCVTADLCTCLHDGQLYQPKDVYADHNSIWSATVHCCVTSQKTLCSVCRVSIFVCFSFPVCSATVRMAPCTAAPLKQVLYSLTSSMMMTWHHPEVQYI